MSESVQSTQPSVISGPPDKKEQPGMKRPKVRRESEDEREMQDALFLERMGDDLNEIKLVEDAFFANLPRTRKLRLINFHNGSILFDRIGEYRLRQVRAYANRYAKSKGLSDPDSLLSRSVYELSVRMGRFWNEERDRREEAKGHTGYGWLIPDVTLKEVETRFFGPSDRKLEPFSKYGKEYSIRAIVGQEAHNIRRVMSNPDSGKMVLMGDLHELVNVAESGDNAEDRRRARMEREIGASLDHPEQFVEGEWIPVEGHDPDDKNKSHVMAYMRSDARDMTKGWHNGKGAAQGTVLQTMHNVTLMRPADTQYFQDQWSGTIRKTIQAVIRKAVKNAYTRRKLSLANPDKTDELYSDNWAQEEEIILRMVEGLKQAQQKNTLLPTEVIEYLMERYSAETLQPAKSRFVANPYTVFPNGGTKIVPGTERPMATIPVWDAEMAPRQKEGKFPTLTGGYRFEPDGVPNPAKGYRFGAGWSIGRMGDVTRRRSLNWTEMAKEVKVSVPDLHRALKVIAGRATKLANRYINLESEKVRIQSAHAETMHNRQEIREGMVLHYRTTADEYGTVRRFDPENPDMPRVVMQEWMPQTASIGTDLVEGFVPGISDLPYAKREEVTIQKEVDGKIRNCTKTQIRVETIHLATEDGELCPTCEIHPIGGTFANGHKPNQCIECRQARGFTPSAPMAEMMKVQKSWT